MVVETVTVAAGDVLLLVSTATALPPMPHTRSRLTRRPLRCCHQDNDGVVVVGSTDAALQSLSDSE